MTSGRRIVCFGVGLPSTRELLVANLPEGFELAFAEANPDRTLTEEAFAAAPGADYLLFWTAEVPTRIVEAATRAKLILNLGEGTERVDVATAARLGIPVAKTAGENSASSAELATLLMLAVLRRLPEAHATTAAGRWLKWEVRVGTGELRGKQVGIVGLGKIGRLVARQVQGFESTVVYNGRRRLPEAEEASLGVRFLSLDELLRTSDVVTLHVPSTPATRALIGPRELALMKPTAVLVNTCRGDVIDEAALYDALKERRIRGAGIDVFAVEPPDPHHPLFSLDNVVLTPHIGGITDDSQIQLISHAYANIVAVESGEPLDPDDIVEVPK